MKITLKQSLISFTLLAGLFLFPSLSFASTYYQQLTDSSNSQDLESTLSIGSFTVATTTTILTGDTGLSVVNISSAPSLGCGVRYSISPNKNSVVGALGHYDWYFGSSTLGVDNFATFENFDSSFTLVPNTTYYVTSQGISCGHATARMNLSLDFFYGYLTGNGTGTSVPIAPGLPGFTDVGIATTSQQVYCNQNFSSSTGLLGGLAQDFSIGLCNSLVFLFAPNSQSLNQFQQLQVVAETKIPFSYVFGLYNVYLTDSSTSTTNLPTFAIEFPSLGSTTPLGDVVPTHIEFFSTTTISKYYPDSIRLSFLFLGSLAIWIFTIIGMYHRVVPKKVL